jgi:hypothetical protein
MNPINLTTLIFLELIFTLVMTGLIWSVQIFHYPIFPFVDRNRSTLFCQFHVKRISYLVVPLMIVELVLALLMIFSEINRLSIINLTLLTLTWLITFIVSAPIHVRLQSNFNEQNIKNLILTNWPRTLLWSTRSLVLIYCLLKKLDTLYAIQY